MDQRKKNIKETLSGFAVVLTELALMVATTFLFVFAFNYVDARSKETPKQAVSSAAQSGAQEQQAAMVDFPQTVSDQNAWQLVLVNYNNRLPDNFTHTLVHQFNVDLDSRIVVPYQKMQDAAQKDNIKLWISSGYRSLEKQDTLFTQEIQNYCKTGLDYLSAVNQAERSVARAGCSEHITGLAIDVNGVREDFDTTPASKWLGEHAQDYGFILRYPKDKEELTRIRYESWHYRYVGVENAQEMKKRNLCLEEYIDDIRENESAGN